jgi:hypothetical protein
MERIAASVVGHGVVRTIISPKAAASATVPACALPPSAHTSACVRSEFGDLTPKKTSWSAFVAQAVPSVPPTFPAPMIAIFTIRSSLGNVSGATANAELN